MYSADIQQLIIGAMVSIVWYKRDLFRIFDSSSVPRSILAGIPKEFNGRELTKREISDYVIGRLSSMGDEGLSALRMIVKQLTNWRDFSAASDPREARLAVERLKNAVLEHDQETEEARQKRELEKKLRQEEQAKRIEKSSKLAELSLRFLDLMSSTDPQKRGYELQDMLYELFESCGLKPGRPFRIVGEQIDGDFVLDGDDFLLEAQWEKDKPTAEELYGFQSKVARKFEGTRGLYVGIQGFSPTSLEASSKGAQPNILLMDGEDLMYVLEERIDLATLLLTKRRHASRTGDVYYKARYILGEG
jgi:hypothetical protein